MGGTRPPFLPSPAPPEKVLGAYEQALLTKCTAAVQRAVKAGLLSTADVDSVITDRVSVGDLLTPGAISQLFANPVEVIAFSDEEGVRCHNCTEKAANRDTTKDYYYYSNDMQHMRTH